MPFKKGQSGNPNGRPKGSPNTDTSLVKEAYSQIINSKEGDTISVLTEISGTKTHIKEIKI